MLFWDTPYAVAIFELNVCFVFSCSFIEFNVLGSNNSGYLIAKFIFTRNYKVCELIFKIF